MQLIDGLQRTTTLIEILNNPSQFFNDSDIDDSLLKRMLELLKPEGYNQADSDLVRLELKRWIKAKTSYSAIIEIQYSEFMNILKAHFQIPMASELEISEQYKAIVESYKNFCKRVDKVKIAAIICEGDSSELPEIFERINTQGTTLSKYEIYAATWQAKYRVQEKNDYIIDKNTARYAKFTNGDLKIDGYDELEFRKQKRVNTFELIFGFSKYLVKSYPSLFEDDGSDITINSAGFSLVNACLLNKNKDMAGLEKKLKDYLHDDNTVNLFLQRVLESVKQINDKLKKITEFKINKRDGRRNIVHSEFQICSLIATHFINRFVSYKFDSNGDFINISYNLVSERPTWRDFIDKFNKNAIKVYLLDIFNSKWAGAGDKRLDQIISNKETYIRNVQWEEFSNDLSNWYSDINQERNESKKVNSPKNPELVFLSLVYLNSFTIIENMEDGYFDIEHLATKKLMLKKIESIDRELRLPISSIGNLCLLPEYTNRAKKDKTIYQDDDYLARSSKTIQDIEKYTFTCKEDMDWCNETQATKEQLEIVYSSFIDKRFKSMVKEISEVFDRL